MEEKHGQIFQQKKDYQKEYGELLVLQLLHQIQIKFIPLLKIKMADCI